MKKILYFFIILLTSFTIFAQNYHVIKCAFINEHRRNQYLVFCSAVSFANDNYCFTMTIDQYNNFKKNYLNNLLKFRIKRYYRKNEQGAFMYYTSYEVFPYGIPKEIIFEDVYDLEYNHLKSAKKSTK